MHTITGPLAEPEGPVLAARSTGVLINRDFALLWGGQAVSNLGDWVFNTTLVLWIATGLARGQSWAPLAVSGALVARFVPTLLVGPLAGVFVDRWDKRRTLLWADALRAALILGLVPVATLSAPPAWRLAAVYGAVVLATVCQQFFDPARLALVGDIVAAPDRPRASGREQMTVALAIVVGPSVAGPLYVGAGVRWALIANALSFAVSFLALLRLRTPAPVATSVPVDKRRALREFAEGLRFFAGNRALTTILVAAVLTMLGSGAINALDIFFVTGNLRAPVSMYGLMSGSTGVGLLAGAVAGGLYAARLGLARVLWLSLVAVGSLVLVYARLTSVGPALVVMFLVGIPNGTLNVVIDPLLLQVTPRALVGRVSGVLMPLMSLAALVSIALTGLLDSTVLRGFHARLFGLSIGPIDTIFTAAALLCIAGGLYTCLNLRIAPPMRQQEDGLA